MSAPWEGRQWMLLRLPVLVTIVACLFAPSIAAAEELVETRNVGPNEVSNGTVTYEAGAQYRIEVTGTRQVENAGSSGSADQEDALYCFQSNSTPYDCDPPFTTNALKIAVAGGIPKPLGSLSESGTPPPYAATHAYSIEFRPAQSGKINLLTNDGCSNPRKCSGSGFAVKFFKLGDGGCGAAARASAVNEVRVVAVQPGVQVHKAGTPEDDWKTLCNDTVLQQGDEISCDPDGAVTLQFADNSTVVVKNTTQLKIASFFTEGGVVKTEILLKMGEVAAKVHKSEATRSDFRIKSPTSVASVRGTDFSVYYDPGSKSTLTTVTDGVVEVDPVAGALKTVKVGAGKEVEVGPKAMTRVTRKGKAGARGGLNRRDALAKVLATIAKSNGPCGITTPRTNATAVKPAPRGWTVALKVQGRATGTSKWTVRGKKITPANALAKRIRSGCA